MTTQLQQPNASADGVVGQRGRAALTTVRRDTREPAQRPLDLKLIARLMGFTRPYARKRNWLLFCVVVRAIQFPAIMWLFTVLITGPITTGNVSQLVWGSVAFFLLSLATAINFHFRHRLANELGEAVVHDLRNRLFEHLQALSMRYFDRTKRGWIIARVNSDVEAVRTGVQDVLFVSIVQFGQMVIAGAVMLWYDWLLFSLVLAIAPVIHVIVRYFRRRLSQAWRDVQESFSRVTATLAESVSGIRVTQGFVRQDVNAALFSDLVTDHANYHMRAQKMAGQFLPLLEFNSQVFTATLLFLGGYLALTPDAPFHANTDVGNIIMFLFMSNLFFSPINVIGRQYNTALTAMAGAERVFAMLDTQPDFVDPPDAVELPPIQGRVELRNLTFGYNPDTPVLHDINFVAQPGELIALVGHTGSGKSSIINLIARFYLPTKGELLIDGYDTRKVTGKSLNRQMGIVLQQNFLFTGTVMDNIRVGRPEASDEEVIAAARKLDVLDLIEAMPNGFDTVVGERGNNLSLGQRQIVCFTRAMLADPRIMILDEATSSVDSMTEARIQKALEALLQGRTSFVVAHRLSTIRHADQVLVLDHGRIVERGRHTELLTQGGVYANMYRQFVRTTEM